MSITRIEIADFQSIHRATLDLGAFTTIIGSSDIGKSAVLRALTAAMTNRRGDDFIRHGEKSCRVTINFDDGTRIEWDKARGKSGVYHLDVPGQAVRAYEKTNGEVPAEVRALLNVSLDVAGDALTPGLQGQHDAPFLLADTARRRAQVLGAFDGSEIALAAESTLRTGQRAAQQALRLAEQQAEAAEATLRAYDPLPAALTAYEAAVAAQQAHGAASERVERLRGLTAAAYRAHLRAGMEAGLAERLTLPAALPSVDAITRDTERLAGYRQAIARCRFMGAAALTDERLARGGTLPASTGALLDMVAAGTDRTERLRVALVGVRHHRRQAEAASALLGAAPPPTVAEVDALRERGERLSRLRGLVGEAGKQRQAEATALGLVAEAAIAEGQARLDLGALAGGTCPECGQPLDLAAQP